MYPEEKRIIEAAYALDPDDISPRARRLRKLAAEIRVFASDRRQYRR